MDTQRQIIFDLVVQQLATIKTANSYTLFGQSGNYKTDIGDRIFVWRPLPFDKDEADSLIVRDLDEPQTLVSSNGLRVERQLHLQVEIVGRGATVDKTLRNEYLADIEIAIGVGAYTVWNHIAGTTRPRISRTVVEQESERIAGMIFEFYIDYPTYAFYPYAVQS